MIQSLTKDPDRFSNEAWILLLNGEDVARRWRHEILDVEHILQVLFTNQSYKQLIDSLSINNSIFLENLEEFLADLRTSNGENLFVGEDLEELLDSADNVRNNWGSSLIEISHLLIALGRDPRIGSQLFEEAGLPSEKLEAELKNLPAPTSFNFTTKETSPRKSSSPEINKSSIKNEKGPSLSPQNHKNEEIPLEKNSEAEINAIDTFGKDLTSAAEAGELDPVIGRNEEIRRLIKVLSRRNKNNPVLIGAPGVGKTAIAELLAQRIVEGEVPESLKGLKIISLDVGALIAGTKFRGQFEERLRSVLTEVSNPDAGIILFIDELHNVLNTDRSIADAGSILKPVLAKGDLRCIGATTPENYRRTIEKDQALNRRFQQVLIKEPSLELSIEILRGIKGRYESHHGISISDQALIAANRLADRYISDRCLPDKAIDLIDEAGAQLKIETTSKPQLIEDAESEVQRIEFLLAKTKTNSSQEKIKNLLEEKILAKENLEQLTERWNQEKSMRKELKNLFSQRQEIKYAITNAEEKGDLEMAARLKYEELTQIEHQQDQLEDSISLTKQSNNSLIKDEVEPADIADVVARWTGIPVNKVLAGERQKLLGLEKELNQKVIGQKEAVQAVAAAIRRARAGMKDPRRPVGSFMFLGPTGVGKTELAKTLASTLFDEEEALVRLDMSEFMERNAVARLLGAPPGYVGYEEGGQLTESVRQRPYAVLLLDEIEKAHNEVFNILLQVLDDGRLTDSQGRTVDFRHTVIVMTSNLASKEILENAIFSKESSNNSINGNQSLSAKIDAALTNTFRPEFLNRIDEIIRFNPLNPDDLQKIIRLHLQDLKALLSEQNLDLLVDEKTIEILALNAYQPEYGARPLRRILRRKLENPLATKLLEENLLDAKAVQVKAPEEGSEELQFIGIS